MGSLKTMPNKHQSPITDPSLVEPNDLLSTLHLNNHRQPPSTAVNKRRSPPFISGEPCAKKLSCDPEDHNTLHHGFSAISLPLDVSSLVNRNSSFPALRRTLSEPLNLPPPESSTPPAVKGSSLPPLPPSLRRTVSDVTPDNKGFSGSLCCSEETTTTAVTATTPDSMRLKRMKDRLIEMRDWWDQVIKEDEEEGEKAEEEPEEGGENCALAAVEDKILSQDVLEREHTEEAISVEWAEKLLSLIFRCPCGKGYELLLSDNKCYYKLV
ncbi:hypothetical protein RJT34_18215 [Clitoria ternatea]|uniref:Uncharacterized protein n=1 Tax=Clitoria ternatea TaxID=43366 RepID=A0AAN9PF81_CLITE